MNLRTHLNHPEKLVWTPVMSVLVVRVLVRIAMPIAEVFTPAPD